LDIVCGSTGQFPKGLSPEEARAVAAVLGKDEPPEESEANTITMRGVAEAVERIRQDAEDKPRRKARKRPTPETVAALVLSDVHYGSVEHDFDGAKIYDPTTAERCVEHAIDELIARRGDCESAALLCAGDLVDGETIYPHQPHEIGLVLYDQLFGLHRLLWRCLGKLRAHFGHVTMYGVPGNHGTSGRYASPRTNWDRILYGVLQILAADSEGIEVGQSYQDAGIAVVAGRRILMRHKGIQQDQTPARQKKLGAWADAHDWELLIHGHFHHPGLLDYHGRPIIRNGAVKPPAHYAESVGLWGLPKQALVTIQSEGPVIGDFGWIEDWPEE
jgi:predicted phosphodiesterase